MKQYEDFEVWIDAAPPDAEFPYAAQVMSSPVGGYVSELLRLNLDDADFQNGLAAASGEEFDLEARKTFGKRLHQALFHGSVGNAWAESLGRVEGAGIVDGLRLRLTINVAEVARLPWELLFDQQRLFLAMAANQAVSRYLPVPEPPRLQITDRLRVLLVVASPAGFETITLEEATQFRARISDLDERFECNLLYNQTKQQIRAALQNGVHVLHFVGHGVPGKLILTDENGEADILTDEQFAGLVHGRSAQLRLVVITACSSAQALKERLFSGIGPSLVQRRIAAVVAMQYAAVKIETAISFSEALYQALASEYPVDVAVNDARGALATGELLDARDWSTPVLYMSTRSGRILNFLGQEQEEVLKLRQLAQGSVEARSALGKLQLSLGELNARAARLRDRALLEGNLRDLQAAADGFAAMVKEMARYASLPEWQPRELDRMTLDILWGQCIKGVDELDRGLSPGSVLNGEIENCRLEFQTIRASVDGLLAAFLSQDSLNKLSGETPKLLDLAGGRLNHTRKSIGSELEDLRDMTLRLRSGFQADGEEGG